MLGRMVRCLAVALPAALLVGAVGDGTCAADGGGSSLGYQWVKVTGQAAYAPRDGAGALVYDGKMWLLGGWNPPDAVHFPLKCNNEVWSSTDGAAWTLVKPNTFASPGYDPTLDWEGRHTAGYAVYQDKMWIVGGDPLQGHYQNDVWNSADGAAWTHVNRDNPVPWGPRVLHHTTVFDGKIWVMGGQTLPQFAPAAERFCNDVWNTTDGVTWNQVATEGPIWEPRGMIGGNVVFNGRMWILGGGTYETPATPQRNYYNDVWSSADGIHWEKVLASAPWHPRQYHDVAVFDGKMWVMEGWDGTGNRRDVWYSSDGANWREVPNTPWNPRHAASVFVYDNALWMVAGNNMERDVWKLVVGEAPEPLLPGVVDFEAPRYVPGASVVGVDGWSDYLGAAAVVTPDAAGSGDTRVIDGSKSLRLGGNSRSIVYRNLGPGTTYDDGTVVSARMTLDGPAGSHGEFFFSHQLAGGAGLPTPAGIVGVVGGNFFLFGLKDGRIVSSDGIDTGVPFLANADYLLEMELDLTNQTFDSYVTNLTAGQPRLGLGTAEFWVAAGSEILPGDDSNSGFVLVTRNNGVALFDELDVSTNAPPHAGDANGDGKVDDLDASILAANWQRTGGATWAQADFNGDGSVNDLDASILAANWQYGAGAAVPEPSVPASLAGLLLAAFVVHRGGKRRGSFTHVARRVDRCAAGFHS